MGSRRHPNVQGVLARTLSGRNSSGRNRARTCDLQLVELALSQLSYAPRMFEFSRCRAGVRVGYADHLRDGALAFTFISARFCLTGPLSDQQKSDLILAWAIGCTSNSNTVTIVKDNMLLGNGVGQQNRVGCCKLAIKRATSAGHNINGAAAYSDSFFPFVDGVEVLQKADIKTIFATSGSVRDQEIKKFCQQKNITLIMLPDKDARGFFGH